LQKDIARINANLFSKGYYTTHNGLGVVSLSFEHYQLLEFCYGGGSRFEFCTYFPPVPSR
jgi:hypothetical protein